MVVLDQGLEGDPFSRFHSILGTESLPFGLSSGLLPVVEFEGELVGLAECSDGELLGCLHAFESSVG